jgi:site-specific recombinase XerD
MPDELVVAGGAVVPLEQLRAEVAAGLLDTARTLKAASRAGSTLNKYRRQWANFEAWCARPEINVPARPASEGTLIAFVASLAQRDPMPALSTVQGYLAAIKWAHADVGLDYPGRAGLTEVMAGYTRIVGKRPRKQASALKLRQLRRILAPFDTTNPADVRDRVILLWGFAAGPRRSELAGVELAHITEDDDNGLVVLLPRSKGDQEGEGRELVLTYGDHHETCPVLAYRQWIATSGIREGRLFRAVRKNGVIWGNGVTDQVVADVMRDRAAAVGLPGFWSGHSMRRGFATSGAEAGVPRHQIMKDGGWGSNAVDRYFEEGTRWEGRTVSKLGL